MCYRKWKKLQHCIKYLKERSWIIKKWPLHSCIYIQTKYGFIQNQSESFSKFPSFSGWKICKRNETKPSLELSNLQFCEELSFFFFKFSFLEGNAKIWWMTQSKRRIKWLTKILQHFFKKIRILFFQRPQQDFF